MCHRIPAGPVSTGALDELDDEELEKLNELEDSESEDDDSDEVADAGVDDVVATDDADVARLEDVTPGVGEGEGSGFEPPPPPPQAVIKTLRMKDTINKPFRFIKFSI